VPYLKSLPDGARLLEVFQANPATSRPLLDYHELLMRGDSPLSAADRELIAAYVSGLNECGYCHGVHTATAEAFGVEPGLLAELVADLDTAPVTDELRALLAYVRKLTRTPSRITEADAQAVFAAGWDDRALYDAVLVCALFNFMNRMVNGLGITADAGYYALSGTRLHDKGYSALHALIED
jgi:uncharacterized peroxidase-related enzyme